MLECVQEVWFDQITDKGFAMLSGVFRDDEMTSLLEAFNESDLSRTKAGIRHALHFDPVDVIAHDPRLLEIAQRVLGENATPFNATLFDKSPDANWLVVWHQDTALPLRRKKDCPAPRGGVLAMRPLLVHSSSKSHNDDPRRVLHIEYSASSFTADGSELARA